MLASLLVKIAADEAREREPQAYRIRPSGITVEHKGEWHGKCPRAAVYHRLNFPPAPRPGRMELVLGDSSWAEHLTNDWIRKSVYRLHSEQMGIDCLTVDGVTLPPWRCEVCHKHSCFTRHSAADMPIEDCSFCLYPGDLVHGHIDGILQDLEGYERVYEHKAINHFAFNRYWDGELPIGYITQPCFYLIGLKKLLVELKEILLLIKCKNTSQYLDYLIEYDQERDVALVKEVEHSGYGKKILGIELPGLVVSAVENWKRTERFYQESKELGKAVLPLRPFDHDSWQCSYCEYSEICWSGYEAEFQELATGVEFDYDFAGMCRDERQLAAEETVVKTKREEIRTTIKKWLHQMDTRSGRAGEYLIDLSLATRSKFDSDRALGLLMQAFGSRSQKKIQAVWDEATKETFSESLRVREAKK